MIRLMKILYLILLQLNIKFFTHEIFKFAKILYVPKVLSTKTLIFVYLYILTQLVNGNGGHSSNEIDLTSK